MNNYERYFGTPELAAMTLCDMELWFRTSSKRHMEDFPDDLAGLQSACLAELFNSGGYTIYGSQSTLEWLREDCI